MAKLTKEEVQKRIDENFDQKVLLISDYINARTDVILRCLECGYEWKNKPHNFIYANHKHKCPNCGFVKGEYFKCAYCGKEVYRTPKNIKKNKSGFFYCSHTCGNLHKNELRKQSGEWDNSLNYRLRAFEQLEHKCVVCGWDDDDRILEVHHIDENRENNNIENLCILCPTCHRKITLHLYELTSDFQLIDKSKQ